jgi:outer membrane protein assembly factor BamB
VVTRGLLALALAGCTAQAAPAPPSLKLLVEVPAWDVEAIANRMVVVDDGLLGVTAFDAASGAKAWSAKLQKQPARGAHGLLINGGSLLAWFGDKIHILDGATGKIGTSYTTVTHGSKCWLDIKEGACARRCDCSFQIADCATGALKGKSYDGVYMEEVDPDGSMSAGCWGNGGWLHGRVGNLALIASEDAAAGKQKSLAKNVAAAIDLATGREVWRFEIYASIQSYESGHSPDGKTCWFSGIMDDLQVLDCATGKLLWSTKPPAKQGANRHAVAFVPGKGIFEQVDTTATLRAERTGKVVWSAKLPAGTSAWIRGTDTPLPRYTEVASITLLDGATGKITKTLVLPSSAYVFGDRGGAFLVESSTGLVAYDAQGKVTASTTTDTANLDISPSFVTARLDKEIRVLDRKTLRELARLPGAHGSVRLEGALGAGRLVAYFYDGKTIGKAALYALVP